MRERDQMLAAVPGIESALQRLASFRQQHADAYQVVSRAAYGPGNASNRQFEIDQVIGVAHLDSLIAGRMRALGLMPTFVRASSSAAERALKGEIMRLRYSVSFESDLQPVRTGRGEIDVANPRLGVRRALEAAQKQWPNARWRSVVVVLEKVEQAAAASEAA